MAAEASGQPATLTARDEPREGREEPAAGANDGSSGGIPLTDHLRKLQKRFQQEEEYITLLKAENDLLQAELQHLISQVSKQQARKSRRSMRSAGGLPRNCSTETSQSVMTQQQQSPPAPATAPSVMTQQQQSPPAPTTAEDASSKNAENGDANELDGAKVAPPSSVADQAMGSEDECGSILMVDPLKYRLTGVATHNLSPMQMRFHRLITWQWFDVIIGVVIFFNSVVIGWESEYYARRGGVTDTENEGFGVFDVLEIFFMVVYIIELGLRYAAYSWPHFLQNRWAQFDTVLVLGGIVQFVLFGLNLHLSLVDKVMLGRILRLARLARLVRLSAYFRELWLLINGLMHSVPMLFYTFITMGIVTYVFAIIGLETIKFSEDAGKDYNDVAVSQFGSLGRAMLTLIQAITLDSIGAVYSPIILHDARFAVYFVTFMLIGSIALMNLVTAIMVDTSMEQANSDRETRKALEDLERRKLVVQLSDMFREMDADGSGRLDLHELKHAPPQVMEKLQDIVKMDDAVELFRTLDTDGSGSLGITEFCEGVLKASQGKPMELLSVMKQCRDILGNLKELSTAMQAVKGHLPRRPTEVVMTAVV